MKQYKLLKDLPNFEAGRIFTLDDKEAIIYTDTFIDRFTFGVGFIKNFDEWFEEIKEPEFFYYTDEKGLVAVMRTNYRHADIHLRKAIGNYFETKEEAKKHLEWLKARAILLEDTKGFKPDYNDDFHKKYFVYYSQIVQRLGVGFTTEHRDGIFFKTSNDAENSIKAHEKEWKIYLGVE